MGSAKPQLLFAELVPGVNHPDWISLFLLDSVDCESRVLVDHVFVILSDRSGKMRDATQMRLDALSVELAAQLKFVIDLLISDIVDLEVVEPVRRSKLPLARRHAQQLAPFDR